MLASQLLQATQLAVTQASGEDALASGQGLYGAVSMAVGAVTAAAGGILYQEGGAAGVWWASGTAMVFFMMIAWWRGADLKETYKPDSV